MKRVAVMVDGKAMIAPVIGGPMEQAILVITGALSDADVERIVPAFSRK